MAHHQPSPEETDANEWTDMDMESESDSDEFLTISTQVLGEGTGDDIYAYYAGISTHSTANISSPGAAEPPTPVHERLAQFRKSSALSPLRTARTWVDPFIAVKEMLWEIEDIDALVERTLDRMGKAFAYNSVYFLKVVLDLQVMYLAKKHMAPSQKLSLKLVLRIAEVLSSRLTRKEKDSISLSRELQLRTLVSALTLLQRMENVGRLQGDTYMQLLRDISERDADNEEDYSGQSAAELKSGDNEYLTRYACDCVRALPADVPAIFDDLVYLNEEATHFLFASGFINQLEARLTPDVLASLFARIKAPAAPWHSTIRERHEGTLAAISFGNQALFKKPTIGSQFGMMMAKENGESLILTLQDELRLLEADVQDYYERLEEDPDLDEDLPITRDTLMYICGLLDILCQLVAAFPGVETIVDKAKKIAFEILRVSEIKAFRYKAFEIIISSTVGMGEDEYYDTMRNLDFEVESMARATRIPDTRTEAEKLQAIERVEQLKVEKRDAMDRYEKKAILSTGAADSIQRRVQGFMAWKNNPAVRTPLEEARSLDEVLAQARGCSRTNTRPEGSATSSEPTLSSVGNSTDSTCGSQACTTPTRANTEAWYEGADGELKSPADTGTCRTCCCCISPTDTCESGTCTTTLRKTVQNGDTLSSTRAEAPMSPRLSISERMPASPIDLHDVVTPGAVDAMEIKVQQLSQLMSSPGMSWDPGFRDEYARESDDGSTPTASNQRRKSSLALPIQRFDSPLPVRTPPPVPPEASMPEVVPSPGRSRAGSHSTTASGSTIRADTHSVTSMDLPFRLDYSFENPVNNVNRGQMQTLHELSGSGSTPTSTYPEPSLSRQPSITPLLKRSSRTQRRSLRLDKPLPLIPPIRVPLENLDRDPSSIAADNAPEVVPSPPPRSQSAMGVRTPPYGPASSRGRNNSTLGFRTPQLDRTFAPLDPIEDTAVSAIEFVPGPHACPINYHEKPLETTYKFQSKDSCFATAITRDIKHAVFLSPHSFQIFEIPLPDQPPQLKPKIHYRLGDWEGLKKSKIQWKYKGMAVSDRYLVTIAEERVRPPSTMSTSPQVLTPLQLQVHDIHDASCRVIFNDQIKGWDLTAVDIAADKLVVALSKSLRNREGQQDIGRIRIYRMNPPSHEGHRYEQSSDRDIFLTDKTLIPPDEPQDSARLLHLSSDGHFLTCATTNLGHYFAWDLSISTKTPRLIAKGQLKFTSGDEAEHVTGVTLFPDAQHLLVSTFPLNPHTKPEFGGSYIQNVHDGAQESVRQVSPRVQVSAVSPYGAAAAFLSKNGTVWSTPIEYITVKGTELLTSFASSRSTERLAGEPSSSVMFDPTGQRLVGVDRKGKCVVFVYAVKPGFSQSAPPSWRLRAGPAVQTGPAELGTSNYV